MESSGGRIPALLATAIVCFVAGGAVGALSAAAFGLPKYFDKDKDIAEKSDGGGGGGGGGGAMMSAGGGMMGGGGGSGAAKGGSGAPKGGGGFGPTPKQQRTRLMARLGVLPT